MFVKGCYVGMLDNFCMVYQVQPGHEKRNVVYSLYY